MQLFILLLDIQALISSIIYRDEWSFKYTSNPSLLIFIRFFHPPPLHHHPHPCPHAANLACQPRDEPLPSIEGCGLDYQHHCSLRSEDAGIPTPPLSKGMWVADFHSMEDLEREDCKGGTQEVGGLCGVLQKWATMFVVACFLPSLSPSLTLMTLNLTDVSTMMQSQVYDMNDSRSMQITTVNDSNNNK